MTKLSARGWALAGLLTIPFASTARAGLFGGDDIIPTLDIAPAEIHLNVPMPASGADLATLLARSGKDHSLSAMKDAAVRNYQQYLEQTLDAHLRSFFAEQEVPLVNREGVLGLHNQLDIKVVKNFTDVESNADYELERGTVGLAGHFHYQLQNAAGALLREQTVDISRLKIREKYQVKSPHSGGVAEDTTEKAIKLALAAMVKKILDEVGDDLEADELEDLVAG